MRSAQAGRIGASNLRLACLLLDGPGKASELAVQNGTALDKTTGSAAKLELIGGFELDGPPRQTGAPRGTRKSEVEPPFP